MKILNNSHLTLVPADMTDQGTLIDVLQRYKPDEVYHLAAQSFVGISFGMPIVTGEIDALGTARVLEAVRLVNQSIRVYIASTSELYGNSIGANGFQDENTPMCPNSPYGAAKLYGFHLGRQYREAYGMWVSNGILFNHESPIRGLEFVTRKISNAVAKIKAGYGSHVSLGNVKARRDWGFAGDYVDAMHLIMIADNPDDYVIATGETHSVEEFAQEAFKVAGLDHTDYVKIDHQYDRPNDVPVLKGNASKASTQLFWRPRISFKKLVEMMVLADIARWEKYNPENTFPWDVPNAEL
jgi:GDPmannose 4,6-dehydratase